MLILPTSSCFLITFIDDDERVQQSFLNIRTRQWMSILANSFRRGSKNSTKTYLVWLSEVFRCIMYPYDERIEVSPLAH